MEIGFGLIIFVLEEKAYMLLSLVIVIASSINCGIRMLQPRGNIFIRYARDTVLIYIYKNGARAFTNFGKHGV